MNDRFDKFTGRARHVLTLAQAQRFNHNYIGTEHPLLGLIRQEHGVAAPVLRSFVELERVRSAVEYISGRGAVVTVGEIGLTPRAKKVIELAVDEARRLGHHYGGAAPLLRCPRPRGQGPAAGVLENLGVNLEKVRSQTIQVLGVRPAEPAPATGPLPASPGGIPYPRWEYAILLTDARDPQHPIVSQVQGAPDTQLDGARRSGGWELWGGNWPVSIRPWVRSPGRATCSSAGGEAQKRVPTLPRPEHLGKITDHQVGSR